MDRSIAGSLRNVGARKTAGEAPISKKENMELKVILYDVKDGIATVTLNRPQRRNSWTGRMHAEYRWVLDISFAPLRR
jgi:1,4-dihydroxy-2-naphthoyl-CoA synthase